MSAPSVTYGGVTLGGATLYDWEYASGSSPVERVFTCSVERVDVLKERLGKAGSLQIKRPDKSLTADEVYLLEVTAGDDPFTRRIRLADRRWLWPKRWVSSTLNLRRANGDKFLAGNNLLENKLIQPEIRYARFSLYPPSEPRTKWTAKDALTWLVEEQLETPIKFRDEPPAQVEIEDLDLDDQGSDAVERVLAYLPGMALYIDRFGTAVVYDTQSKQEAEILASLPAPQTGSGMVEVVDKSALRPSEVICLFTPEVEMRFDFVEEVSTVIEDRPNLFNVAPVPDISVEIGGQDYARGSYLTLRQLFEAWGAFGYEQRAMTLADLRKSIFRYGWAAFEAIWGQNPNEPPDQVNMLRAATTVQSFRRTFRIDRYWLQRLAAIRPYRASILNFETGAYGPAEVFCDWTRRPSYKGVANLDDPNNNHGWAVRGWASDLSDALPAPAKVVLLDGQAGILDIVPQVDKYGLSQAMFLGYPTGGILPSQDLTKANQTGKELYARWDMVEVADDFKMAVLLTVVPGSPNDLRRFHHVSIDPADLRPEVGPCNGPPVYLRIFPGIMTARFGWKDSASEQIIEAVRGDGPSLPSELLLNDELVQDVALAAAMRVYESLRDRPQGSIVVDMSPDVEPGGTISSVRHGMASGSTISAFKFQAATQAIDLWRYMPASTRKAIRMTLENPTGGA